MLFSDKENNLRKKNQILWCIDIGQKVEVYCRELGQKSEKLYIAKDISLKVLLSYVGLNE